MKMPSFSKALCRVAGVLGALGAWVVIGLPSTVAAPSVDTARASLGRLAVPFVENRGEMDARVALVARTATGAVYVGHDGELTYALSGASRDVAGKATPSRWALKERLVGAHVAAVRGAEPSGTRVARFVAGDLVHAKATNAFARADLGEAWPGVRVAVKATGESAEKFFYVAAGADAAQIRVDVDGSRRLAVNAAGELVAPTGIGDVRFTAPVAWQEVDGARRDVPVRYALLGEHRYGFALGTHDAAHEVVIDPVIQSTYIGGSSTDQIYAMAIHPTTGDVYVTGRVQSTTLFPISAGAIDATHSGLFDAFIARLPADLKTFTEVTLFGGSGNDVGADIKIHPVNGDIYLAGTSLSSTLPGTAGAAQPAGSTNGSPFVARFSPDLQTLVRTTFYGNNGFLVYASSYLVSPGLALVISPTTGTLYLSCTGHSTTIPNATGGAIVTHGDYFGYVTAIAADLASFGQGTYVSGTETSGATFVSAMALDPANDDLVVTGVSDSTTLPVTAGAAIAANTVNPNSVAARVGFVARFPKELTSVKALTYYYEQSSVMFPSSVMLVGAETVIGGEVNATTLTPLPGMAGGANPTPYSFQSNYGNGFIVRLSNDLKTIVQGTYVRGTFSGANASAVSYDVASSSYVVALGDVSGLPGLDAGTDTTAARSFVTRISGDLKSVVHSIALSTDGIGLATQRSSLNGDLYVAGFTGLFLASSAGGAQAVNNGNSSNGFITRMTIDLSATASPGQIAFGSGAYSTIAGTPGSVVVTRSAGSSGQVSVSVTTSDGSATAPADYSAVTTSVTFADGDTTAKAVPIPTAARTSTQGSKTVAVTLSAVTGGATIGGQASTVLTIADAAVVVVPPEPPASAPEVAYDSGGGGVDAFELALLALAVLMLGVARKAKARL